MRKIVESTLASVDGVFGDPQMWTTEYFDQEAEDYALELLSAADAMLLGRRTYEFFRAAFPHRTGDYGDRVNHIRKYVFSNTLTGVEWGNSTVVEGDAATEAANLKSQNGKDLVMYGHGLLGRTLLKHHLVDELKLWIHPLLVGRGQLLFGEGDSAKLELVSTRTLGTGIIVATYRPVWT